MSRVKKIFCFLLTLSIFSLINFSAFASEPVYTDKQRFANEKLSLNQSGGQNIDAEASERVNRVLLKYAANDIEGALEIMGNSVDSSSVSKTLTQNTELSYEILENYLNAHNVYIYSCETNPNISAHSSGSTDVQMNRVIISLNANNNTWTVTGGGFWNSDSYLEDVPTLSVLFGAIDVGGTDAVGVSLTDTSGTFLSMTSSSGYVHDGHGKNMTLRNRYAGIGSSDGVVFQYRDQVYISDDLRETCYMGYGFSAQAVYNSKFAQYHGDARSYYAHTWDECSVDSIGLGTNSFSASWSDSSCGWEVYSDSDTTFEPQLLESEKKADDSIRIAWAIIVAGILIALATYIRSRWIESHH